NGRRVFCKGANCVPPDIFPGVTDEARYRDLTMRGREANFNMLRLSGGGIVCKHAFYRLCPELRIMVWTGFPLARNAYPDSAEYLALLDAESWAIITRLREHPCLVLWCGGNELFNVWSGMTEQSLPLRLLAHNTYELDPARPFLSTTPLTGMGHGY